MWNRPFSRCRCGRPRADPVTNSPSNIIPNDDGSGTATKVKLADVARLLPKDTPKVTPEQRQATLRERRRALLERPYW